MSRPHAPDARFFVCRGSSENEYSEINDALVEVNESYLKYIYNTYAPMFEQEPFKKDDVTHLKLTHGAATFIELDWSSIPNKAGLEKYWQVEGGEDWVELDCMQFEMLESRAEAMRGYSYLVIYPWGLAWRASEKHSGEEYRTSEFTWKDLWPPEKKGRKRCPKPKPTK